MIKIEIRQRPVFYLPLTLELVKILSDLSMAHYDSRCQSAAKVGGFIYGWINLLTFVSGSPVQEGTPPCGPLTSHEMDTLAKILELTPYVGTYSRPMLVDLQTAIHAAMREAGVWH